jgi:hypothetical protein
MVIVAETFCDVNAYLKYDTVFVVVGWLFSDTYTRNTLWLSVNRVFNGCTEILELCLACITSKNTLNRKLKNNV